MSNLSLGNTLEEKRQTYLALTEKSKKWGKVFAILGALMGVFLGGVILGSSDNIFLGVLIFVIMCVGFSFGYYWYGKMVFYGYLVMRSFFRENNVDGAAVAGAVGTSFLVSYVLGGKKATKKLGIMWIGILLFSLTIGIIAGLYYYIKFYKEAKKLGLKNNDQLPNTMGHNNEDKKEPIKAPEIIKESEPIKELETKMFCASCGKKLEDGAVFCAYCGAKVNSVQTSIPNPTATVNGSSYHTVPKCNCCGNIGEWKVGPLFRQLDYVVGVVLLFFGFVPGLIYFGVVGLIRSNKDNREKICKKCGAKNMFTNMY